MLLLNEYYFSFSRSSTRADEGQRSSATKCADGGDAGANELSVKDRLAARRAAKSIRVIDTSAEDSEGAAAAAEDAHQRRQPPRDVERIRYVLLCRFFVGKLYVTDGTYNGFPTTMPTDSTAIPYDSMFNPTVRVGLRSLFFYHTYVTEYSFYLMLLLNEYILHRKQTSEYLALHPTHVLPEFFIECRYRTRIDDTLQPDAALAASAGNLASPRSGAALEPGEQLPPRIPFVPALAHSAALLSYAKSAQALGEEHPLVAGSPSFGRARRAAEKHTLATRDPSGVDALAILSLDPATAARPEVWWGGGTIAKPALAVAAAKAHVTAEADRKRAGAERELQQRARAAAIAQASNPNRRVARPRPMSPPLSPTAQTATWRTATDALVAKARSDQRRFWKTAHAEWRAEASSAARSPGVGGDIGIPVTTGAVPMDAAEGLRSTALDKWERADASALQDHCRCLTKELAKVRLASAEVEHAALVDEAA